MVRLEGHGRFPLRQGRESRGMGYGLGRPVGRQIVRRTPIRGGISRIGYAMPGIIRYTGIVPLRGCCPNPDPEAIGGSMTPG